MRHPLTPRFAVSVLLLALLALAAGPAKAGRDERPTEAGRHLLQAGAGPHVVVISLDGFPASAVDDPLVPLPTLRQLASRGAVAGAMRPVNPTVTWPNHTSLVTGVHPARHGVLYNGSLIRDHGREPGVPPRVEPWRDKALMVRAPTIYDLAHARGLTTAQVDWVAIHNAPTITWAFAERPDPAALVPRELVAAGVLSQADLDGFASRHIVFRDRVWTEAAAHIIRTHRPNLLLFHLLNLDSTHHRYGPRTHAAITAMAHLDAQVKAILDAIEEAKLTARTTIFVVSDHGFKLVKRQIRLNAALAEAGLLQLQDGKVVSSQVYAVPEGGSAIVYVTVPDPTGDLLARARRAIAPVEGIDRVIEPDGFAALGLPLPADDDQMGSLFVIPKEGYSFAAPAAAPVVVDAAEGSLGAHGYVASDPELGAIFIASGSGIKAGVKLSVVENVDVAPTIARLLGLQLDGADGRVLTEILATSSR
jgi:predicted AlkP superfamily pyrophosphatase or phosphodiesterase